MKKLGFLVVLVACAFRFAPAWALESSRLTAPSLNSTANHSR